MDQPEPPVNDAPADARPRTATLFLVSVLGLFLELMLIRWVGTEVRIFAYLQNTVLVVCFMGLGMGFMTGRRSFSAWSFLGPLALLTLTLALPLTRAYFGRITELLTVLGDLVIWSKGMSDSPARTALSLVGGLGLTLVLMALIWAIFVPIGRLTGRLMSDHPRTILAYSVNVAGALAGIWLFVGLSAWELPPVAWLATVSLLSLPLVVASARGQERGLSLGVLAVLPILGWLAGREPGAMEVVWSPYQKLVLREKDPERPGIGRYLVNVNNTGYQAMIDLSDANVRGDEASFPPAMRGLSQYDIPFRVHPRPASALIVGAGSGNDVAGALRNGVDRVTAVEIDPAIIDLGRRYHPERPYDSPKVTLVNDDARSFFASCPDKFDLILFGLLDSHTTTAMTNARLDHYVYTRESLRLARSLLAEGGVMVLSFEAQKPFIADRMARVLREVFGEEPLAFRVPMTAYGWGGVMFVVGNPGAVHAQLAADGRLAGLIAGWQKADPVVLPGTTRVTTDDWPYIYLESPSIPLLYGLLAVMLLALLVFGASKLELRGLVTAWDRPQWHFFFLGAAFLLLEVQNISKASVVLGNTWTVNAVIISGILAMVLLANLAVARLPKLPPGPVYAVLVLTCLGLGGVDVGRLGTLPVAARAVLVGGLTSLPIFFSGIVFTRSYALSARKDQVLGANLIGALFGGILQSVTFLVGTRALLGIVAGFYLVTFLTRPRSIAAVGEVAKPHAPRSTEVSRSLPVAQA